MPGVTRDSHIHSRISCPNSFAYSVRMTSGAWISMSGCTRRYKSGRKQSGPVDVSNYFITL